MMKEKQLHPELIGRFIRVEQRVSAHFGKPIDYHQTEYFKSLSNNEKKCFEEYLKKRKGFFQPIIIGILFLSILLLNISITGQAIKNNLHTNNYILTGVFLVVLIVLLVNFFISFLDKKNKEKRFSYHLKPLERALTKQKKKTL